MHDLVNLSRAFLSDLAGGSFARAAARFDGPMQTAVPLVALGSTWKRLIVKVGRLLSYDRSEETRSEIHPEYRILLVACRFERGTYTMRLWFNRDGRISGMSMEHLDPALNVIAS